MPRRRLTEKQKKERLKAQNYTCPGCAKTLMGARKVEWDHRRDGLPRWFFEESGLDPDDPEHQYAMHKKCHDKLFKDDMERISKTKRQMGEQGQRNRRLLGSTRQIPHRSEPWS